MKINRLFLALALPAIMLFVSCEDSYTPKPHGYFRIELPPHKYEAYKPENCPFVFEKSVYARIDPHRSGRKCWFNLVYPAYKATVHFSYFDIRKDSLDSFIEDSYTLASKHLVKAKDMEESTIIDDSLRVYGVIYDFKGAAASNYQFFITDSTAHFIRASLYFDVPPEPDSLAPVEAWVEEDLLHLVNTFTWKD